MALKTNTNTEDFGDVAAAHGVTITHASIIFNHGASSDPNVNPNPLDRPILYWTGALANSRALSQGDAMEFPAGSIDITLPAGDLVSEGIQRINQAAHDDLGSPTVLLGTNAMGADGTANEVTDAGYTRQQTEFTITA